MHVYKTMCVLYVKHCDQWSRLSDTFYCKTVLFTVELFSFSFYIDYFLPKL